MPPKDDSSISNSPPGSASGPVLPENYVSEQAYLDLLAKLATVAHKLIPPPDCVIGMKRSGLFPAVYLSHQLHVPMLVDSETKNFPVGKFQLPLIVDTTCWNGRSLRVVYNRLVKAGVGEVRSLVMYARTDPQPNIEGLMHLQTVELIPRFWYSDTRVGGK